MNGTFIITRLTSSTARLINQFYHYFFIDGLIEDQVNTQLFIFINIISFITEAQVAYTIKKQKYKNTQMLKHKIWELSIVKLPTQKHKVVVVMRSNPKPIDHSIKQFSLAAARAKKVALPPTFKKAVTHEQFKL